MAKCRLCKKNVPDGIEYCEDCLDKKQQTDESYLDSLLNSVKNNPDPIRDSYKKPQETRNSEPKKVNRKADEIRPDQIDPADLADFDQYDLSVDLDDLIVIGDDELFGHIEDFDEEDRTSAEKEDDSYIQDEELYQTLSDEDRVTTPNLEDLLRDIDIDTGETEAAPENTASEEKEPNYFMSDSDDYSYQPQEDISDHTETEADTTLQGIQDNIDLDFLNQLTNPTMEDAEEESFDPSLGELLSGFGLSEGEPSYSKDLSVNEVRGRNDAVMDQPEQAKMSEEEEFLSLLGQLSTDDPVAADVQAISELLNYPANSSLTEGMPSDVGEVFSDALTAVSGLADPEAKRRKSKKSKDTTKGKQETKKNKATKGKGLFGKLFGNVVDDKVIKEAKKSKASDELAAAKEKKKGKGKKGKKDSTDILEELQDVPRKRLPIEEVAEEPKPKKEKKPKKIKKKDIELIDDYDEIEGRINRLGATVVFTFFGALVALLLIGTTLFTYSVSIKNAKTYFDRQKYTEAYNEVYGMELRDEDIELYERIMTVMFVNKQLNSYNNYYAMEKYPEALDSLMKGLKRYDKYIELATMLGIKSDLDYVRNQIMGELEHVYRLSEEEIDELLHIENQRDYSIAVYNAVIEKMNY